MDQGQINVFVAIIGRHFLSGKFPPKRYIICIYLSIRESSSEFLFLYIFFETPLAEWQAQRHRDFLHTASSAEPHLPKDPTDLAAAQPPQALMPDQVWRDCRAVTPHGFLQVSYLVPICVDILSWIFFHCLPGVYTVV